MNDVYVYMETKSLAKWLSVRLWTKWLRFESHGTHCSHLNKTTYSRMDQVKFVEEYFMVCLKQNIPLQIFLKAVFHEFYLVHSWLLCPIQNKVLSWRRVRSWSMAYWNLENVSNHFQLQRLVLLENILLTPKRK